MKVTTKARYGLRALVRLAKNGGAPLPLSSIAEGESVSVKYLERIFSSLKRGGIVEAASGKKGGYRLARPASEITIADVLRAVGERISLLDCVEDTESCQRWQNCPTRDLWRRLSSLLENEMQNMSIADLIG